ncbi:MAG: ExbD/TolR family protein [Flavobacteriales bacterium]
MNIRSRNKLNTGFNQSSMTDLIFLLLIFFIIVSTLVSPYALPVELPQSDNRTKKKPKISVTIDKDGNHFVNAKKVQVDNIENVLKDKLSSFDNKSIVFHVDKNVPSGKMVNVLDIAKQNKWNIVLATKVKK